MSDPSVERIISEAALAKRFENEINERASKADIPTLVEAVNLENPHDEDTDSTNELEIGFDTDGVPYLKTGGV